MLGFLRRHAPVLTVLALETLWMLPALMGERVFFGRDLPNFRMPYLAEFARAVLLGGWPTWTARMGGGMPLWHHPANELANPASWLAVFMELPSAYATAWWLHLMVATLAVNALARRLNAQPWLAAWAGGMYVATGPVSSLWSVGHIRPTALPLMALGGALCGRAWARHTWLGPLLVMVGTTFHALNPDPPAVAAAVAATWCLAWLCAPRTARMRTALHVCAAMGVGGLLAAPFLVPAFHVVLGSARTGLLAITEFKLDARALLDSVAPGAGGQLSATGPSARLLLLLPPSALCTSLFVGSTTLAFTPAALLIRKDHIARGLVVVAALLFALGLGNVIPGASAIWNATATRFPDKLLLAWALLSVLVAARLGTRLRRNVPRRVRAASGAMLGISVLLLMVAPMLADAALVSSGADAVLGMREAAYAPMVSALRRSAGVLAVAVGATALLARRPGVAGLLLVVLGAVEAAASLDASNISTPRQRFDVLSASAPTPGGRIFSGPLDANPFALHPSGVQVPDDNGVAFQAITHAPLTQVVHGDIYVVTAEYSALETAAMRQLMITVLPSLPPAEALVLLHALGVQSAFVRAPEPLAADARWAILRQHDFGFVGIWTELVFTREAPGLVSLEPDWRSAATPEAAAAALIQGAPVVVGVAAPTDVAARGSAEVVEFTDTELVVNAAVPGRQLLVRRLTHAPGWQVSVDGKPAELLPANLVQHALMLEPGQHTVRFFYEVPGAALGMGLGLLGLALAMLMWRERDRLSRP